MPRKKASLKMLQILDENGNLNEHQMPDLNEEDLKKMFELMILGRKFDETLFALQREGRVLTFAPGIGQEAAQVGSAYALEKEDWMVPAFRENAAFMTRGFPISQLIQYWSGDERGSKIPDEFRILPVAIPVSTQIPHAVGIAWASKLRNEKNATMVYFGDGATSKGDFHEALNFAGVFKIPVVFVCQNNQYAISFPRKKQTASESIAQKALAYGFDGVLVDGNDVIAVYKAANEALEKARNGDGPTLIECYTYRIADHTTADDSLRYRNQREVDEWKKKDPIDRLRKYLQHKGIWSDYYEKEVLEKVKKKIDDAVKIAESVSTPKIEDMFSFMFAVMPEHLKEQLEMLKSLRMVEA